MCEQIWQRGARRVKHVYFSPSQITTFSSFIGTKNSCWSNPEHLLTQESNNTNNNNKNNNNNNNDNNNNNNHNNHHHNHNNDN